MVSRTNFKDLAELSRHLSAEAGDCRREASRKKTQRDKAEGHNVARGYEQVSGLLRQLDTLGYQLVPPGPVKIEIEEDEDVTTFESEAASPTKATDDEIVAHFTECAMEAMDDYSDQKSLAYFYATEVVRNRELPFRNQPT